MKTGNKLIHCVTLLYLVDTTVHPSLAHAQYHQQFGAMQSLARSQQSVATSAAAAAAAAQVAAAAGVNPMQIMEHPRLIFQPTAAAALGVGGKKYFWYSIIFAVLNVYMYYPTLQLLWI